MKTEISTRSYIIGFLSSVLLTLAAYALVAMHVLNHHEWPSHAVIIPAVIALAVAQLVVQLFFFLHIGAKSTPRSTVAVLLFALLIVFILVGGSLWIMYNLNYNMTAGMNVNAYLNSQDSL